MIVRRWFHIKVLDIQMPLSSLLEIARHKREFPFDDCLFVDGSLNPIIRNSLDGQMYEAIYNEAVIHHLETLEKLEKAVFGKDDTDKELLLEVMHRTGRIGSWRPKIKPINPEEGD